MRYATFQKIGDNCFKVVFTGEKATKRNFQEYLDDLQYCHLDRKPVTILFDATKAKVPALNLQRKQADWMSINRIMIEKYCLGTAYVINNPTIRLVLEVIFSFQNQPVPYKIFKKEEEALAWLDDLQPSEKQLQL
jgi:hypothetical protein